jgi:N-acetylglucosamine-6-phosphate deacetylase
MGVNLEGPFLAQECRGAHDPAVVRDPDVMEFRRLAELAGGTLRVLTLAPELPGAAEVIAAARTAGVVVSIGHSAASADVVGTAVDQGASLVTHLFNGMQPLHHRRPGLVGAALTSPALTCELIADGRHVDPVAVRLAVAARGADGIALVTDCLSPAGLPDGEHELGPGVRVTVTDGLARLPGTGTIAGSTLTMDQAVRNVVRFAGVDLVAASRMASETPARLLGLPGLTGRIEAGSLADLVVLDHELIVRATMVGGTWVDHAEPVGG